MAKSSRASSRKANNQRLKADVFGPVETERNARLSAKLLELATAAKREPSDSESMNIVGADSAATKNGKAETDCAAGETSMDIDTAKSTAASNKSSSRKGRIEKRRKTSKIVFPKYGDKAKQKRKH
ncbi:hypothetical protein EKO27_g9441 [Xylaria grammica]|uniref:DUF2423 domain-containing protein n=1 Tax=Xylaria grammica TaxID=363999 RepID=A0A439CU36_9PEZI|nr:hypothetical protein EKO27_g9441 [Xylaria grammica]